MLREALLTNGRRCLVVSGNRRPRISSVRLVASETRKSLFSKHYDAL